MDGLHVTLAVRGWEAVLRVAAAELLRRRGCQVTERSVDTLLISPHNRNWVGRYVAELLTCEEPVH